MTRIGPRHLDTAAFARRLASGPEGLRALLAIRLAHPQRLAALLGEPQVGAFDEALCAGLASGLAPNDQWSRASLDEVWVLLEGLAHEDEALNRAQRIVEVLQHLPDFATQSVAPLACGLVLHEGPAGPHARAWLASALEAASRSRRHDDALDLQHFERPDAHESDAFLEGLLRDALDSDRLEVHFQPQVDLRSGRCVQVEALVRWPQAHAGGPPGPIAVLPETARGADASRLATLAESRGLIGALTRRVLDQALGQVRAWDVQGLRIDVSVNLSSLNLEDASVGAFVLAACARHRLAPQRLTLELTESRVLRNRAAARAFLQPMRAAGCRVALDDFGTGYASISTLRELPFDELKIDRTFVEDLETSPQAQTLAGALVSLGRSLGLQTLAEGIETRGQAQILGRAHCERGQGYLWSAPRSAAAFEQWLSGFSPTPMVREHAIR